MMASIIRVRRLFSAIEQQAAPAPWRLGQGAQRRSGLLHLAGAVQHAMSTADSRRASWSAAQLRHLKSVRSYRRHTGADQLSVRDGRDNWREVKR